MHVKAQSGSRLPNSIQSVHLEAHFWVFEQTLEEAFILSDPTTKQSRGFGFAVFKSKRAAEAAIRKLDGSVLHECQLKLEMARPKEEADSVNSSSQRPSNTVLEETGKSTASVPSSSGSSTQYKVFVGNYQRVVKVILSIIDEIKFPINSSLLPFFTSPDYVHFSAKIRDELNVLCTYPKARGENKVLKSAYFKTATSEYWIKLEICQGDITNEEVDSIVNAANKGLTSVAFPAISTGIFTLPNHICMEAS